MRLDELKQAIYATDPAALLVPPRVLRRVVHAELKPASVLNPTPHTKSFCIDRQALFRHGDEEELQLDPDRALPARAILIARPTAERLAARGRAANLHKYWRILFHARVHLTLEEAHREGKLTPRDVRQRIEQLGPASFSEARHVLVHELYLTAEADDTAAYIEFAAVFLELWHFRPNLLATYFPSLANHETVMDVLTKDVPAAELFARTRLPGATDPIVLTDTRSDDSHDYYWKLTQQADAAGQRGDVVRAAILYTRAARVAPADRAAETLNSARRNLEELTRRLQVALQVPGDTVAEWMRVLPALLDKADQGAHPVEAMLLYDLQRACLDHERRMFTLDLLEWLRSAGHRPIKRPLPGLKLVRMMKHLRSAAQRLTLARLSDEDRQRLGRLFDSTLETTNHRLRERFRPVLTDAFHDVGLTAANLPEQVALNKMIEELLDTITSDGLITFLDLRDTISRNQLKLADLSDPHAFWRGDPLLRLDRRLSVLMEGVYERGVFYLRWLERIGSIAFGTGAGRFVCRNIVLPFGGAFFGLQIGEVLVHEYSHAQLALYPLWSFWVVGAFILALMQSHGFRRVLTELGLAFVRQIWFVFVETPRRIINDPAIKQLANSWPILLLYWYVLKPLAISALIWLWVPEYFHPPEQAAAIFFAVNLIVNSRFGYQVSLGIGEAVLLIVRRLRFEVLQGLVKIILVFFRRVTSAVEIALHTVQEWLLFQQGESRLALAVRAVLNLLWMPVAFVIRLLYLIAVEPNLNPVKFVIGALVFKVILVFAPLMKDQLLAAMVPHFGVALAWFVTGAYLYLILPGAITFLIWEIQENWKLYRANRPQRLSAVVVGEHGETFRQLFSPGLHSGTVPKVFRSLRRAERQAYRTGDWRPARTYRRELQEITLAVRQFFERDFLVLLHQNRQWPCPQAAIKSIDLTTNGVLLEVSHTEFPQEPVVLAFAMRSGVLTASIEKPGWLLRLPPRGTQVVTAALAGLYKVAGVQSVEEPTDKLASLCDSAEPVEKNGETDLVEFAFAKLPLTWELWVAWWQEQSDVPQVAVLKSTDPTTSQLESAMPTPHS